MTPTLGLASPLAAVKGVGPVGARLLSAAGLDTVLDLLLNLPHRYEDRSNPRTIGSLGEPGEVVTMPFPRPGRADCRDNADPGRRDTPQDPGQP